MRWKPAPYPSPLSHNLLDVGAAFSVSSPSPLVSLQGLLPSLLTSAPVAPQGRTPLEQASLEEFSTVPPLCTARKDLARSLGSPGREAFQQLSLGLTLQPLLKKVIKLVSLVVYFKLAGNLFPPFPSFWSPACHLLHMASSMFYTLFKIYEVE